jgi:hypothetical protein
LTRARDDELLMAVTRAWRLHLALADLADLADGGERLCASRGD